MSRQASELTSPLINNPTGEVPGLKPLTLRRIARPSINRNGDNGPAADPTIDNDGLGQKLARASDNLFNRSEGVNMILRSLAYQQYQQKVEGLPTSSTEIAFAVQSMLIKPAIGTAAAIVGLASEIINGEQERDKAMVKLEEAVTVHSFRSTDVKERVLPEVEAELGKVATERQTLALMTQGLIQQGLVIISPRTGNLMVSAPDVEIEEKIISVFDRRGVVDAKWQRMAREDVETPLTRRTQDFVEQARTRAVKAGIPFAQIKDVVRRGTENGIKILQEQRTKART